jgi:hypothetical protein
MRISSNIFIILLSSISVFTLFQGCGEDSVGPEESDISGVVRFTDTILCRSGGYYAISVYPDQSPVFTCAPPIRSDSLGICTSGNTSSAYYQIKGLVSGSYYIAVTWIRKPNPPYSPREPILGTYHCDTARWTSCNNHIKIVYPSYAGTGNINIIAWTDTLKKLN